MKARTIAVVGNPNCGKTTLFNALTGARQRVGNWPGVTVEKKVGSYVHEGTAIEVVDLPGTYSLSAVETSADEAIARNYVAAHEAALVVNIVDAANLERNLYLTSQLLDMRVPVIVALNMVDLARDRGIRIDVDRLQQRLGCPVVPIVAARGTGVAELKAAIAATLAEPVPPTSTVPFRPEIESALTALQASFGAAARHARIDPRWFALQLLEGEGHPAVPIDRDGCVRIMEQRRALEEALDEEIDILLADGRYGWIQGIAGEAVGRAGRLSRPVSDRIDAVVLNRVLGIPIFLGVMYLMFMFTINLGSAFIDFFDIFAGTVFVDGVAAALGAVGSPDWLTVVLANGIGSGIQTVATFIPIVGFLFLFLSILEDSGYMARAAFVMDRSMRGIGLPGKAFVPLIVGFGCNVPAIMAARTLDTDSDRKTTIVMAPFMSCGARLPVYALFAAAFFPTGGQNLVFALYLIGILVAVGTGFIMKQTLLRGDTSPLVMELPPYLLPAPRNVVLRTWDRLKGFIVRAGRVIVPVVAVLAVLSTLGTDGTFGHEDEGDSVLAEIGRSITPVFEPMGITEENWPATVGIFTGIFAKEAVVGTLDALYGALGADPAAAGDAEEAEAFDLLGGIGAAFATIPENLAGLAGTFGDPLGLNVGDTSSLEGAAAEQGVATGTFGAMAERFDGRIGAFAYLLFILLYIPCVAASAAVYRELTRGWALFVVGWTTSVAYYVSVVFYQAATITRHPDSAMAWIVGLTLVFAAVIAGLRQFGRTRRLVPAAAE